MKLSGAGRLSIFLAAFFPFFTYSELLYPDVNSKLFYVAAWSSLLLLVSAYSVWKGKRQIAVRGRWLLGAVAATLLVEYAAMLLGVFPEHSFWSNIFWSSGVFFFTYAMFLAITLAGILTERDWTGVRRAIAVSGGVFGLFSLFGILGAGFTGNFLWIHLGQTGLTLGNETYAGIYLVLALIVGMVELSRVAKGSIWKPILLVVLAAMALSPLLFNTGLLLGKAPLISLLDHPAAFLGTARASSLAMFVALGFFAGYKILRRYVPQKFSTVAVGAWAAGTLLALGVLVSLVALPGNAVHDAYVQESSGARPIAWAASLPAIGERPVLGWGPENFQYAFQGHIDNRLFLEENLGEIWFERAHNVFIDTLVNVGVVGLLGYVLIIAAFLYTIIRAKKRSLISETEAVLWGMLPFVHLLQLQTGFDTVGSYTLLALIGGYVLHLERLMSPSAPHRFDTEALRKGGAVLLVVLVLVGGKLLLDEYVRQAALFHTFKATTALEQRAAVATSLSRTSDFESLRLSFASFVKGIFISTAGAPTDKKAAAFLPFLTTYEGYFKEAIAQMPTDYRARMNYAYLLLLKTGFGENRITEAKEVIRASYELSPGNPITYILDSVTELYSGNIKEADRLMAEALAINPDLSISKEAAAYLARQKASFPNISVLKFTNL